MNKWEMDSKEAALSVSSGGSLEWSEGFDSDGLDDLGLGGFVAKSPAPSAAPSLNAADTAASSFTFRDLDGSEAGLSQDGADPFAAPAPLSSGFATSDPFAASPTATANDSFASDAADPFASASAELAQPKADGTDATTTAATAGLVYGDPGGSETSKEGGNPFAAAPAPWGLSDPFASSAGLLVSSAPAPAPVPVTIPEPEPTATALYKCLLPAGVTADLEPGEQPQVIMQYHQGDLLEVFKVQATKDGRTRVQTRDGWVSLVSGSGKELLMETSKDPFAAAIAMTEPASGSDVRTTAKPPSVATAAETEESDFGDFLARLGSQLDGLSEDDDADNQSTAPLSIRIDLNESTLDGGGKSATEATDSSPLEIVPPPLRSPVEDLQAAASSAGFRGSKQMKESSRLSEPKANAGQLKLEPNKMQQPKEQADPKPKAKPRRRSPTVDVGGSSFAAETASSRQRMSPRRELIDQRASPEEKRSMSPGGSWHFAAQQEAASHQSSQHHHHRDGGAEAQAHPHVAHRSTAASRSRTGQAASVWDQPASAQSRHKTRDKVDQRRSGGSGEGGSGGITSSGGGSIVSSSVGTTLAAEDGLAVGTAPFTPQIAPKSHVLAAGRRQRLQAEGHGFGHTSYGELLYRRGHEARAHKHTKAEAEVAARIAAVEEAELAECTFTPSRVTVTSRAARARAAKVTNGRSEERPRKQSISSEELLSPGTLDASMEARTAAFMTRREEALAVAKQARADAELQECTFTPSIKKHKHHNSRPKVKPGSGPNMARIEQIVKNREATLQARQEHEEQLASQTRRLAVPEINAKSRRCANNKRAESGEDRDLDSLDLVQGDLEENGRNSLPVHERLFQLSIAHKERRDSLDQSQYLMNKLRHKQDSGHYAGHSPRSPSPKTDRDASQSPEQRAQQHDVAKIALARMQKDIAKRRAKDAARQEQKEEELYSNANGSHTLQNSERLQRGKLVKALRRVFMEVDEDGKGGLSFAELERALRQLRVLRMGLEHHDRVDPTEGDSGGSRHRQETHVLQLLGHLFEYGSEQGAGGAVLVDFNCFKQLLTRVFRKDEELEPPTGAGALELLPPEVGDQLVSELQALHAVNKHAFATGAGATYKQLRKEAVDAAVRENTFAPTINSRSRKLERLNNAVESVNSSNGHRHSMGTFTSPSSSARRADTAAFTPPAGGGNTESRHERLYRSGQISARKKMEAQEEALATESERAGCTFWPKTSKQPRSTGHHQQPVFSSDCGSAANDESSYYGEPSEGLGELNSNVRGSNGSSSAMSAASGNKIRLSRAEKLAYTKTTAALKEEEELSECFFYPVTNPPRQAESANSHEDKSDANRSEGASPVSTFQDKASTVVRGYDEQVQRLRNGPNGIETKRREQERLHRQRKTRESEPTTQAVTKPVGPGLLSREPVAAKRAKPILNMEVNAGAGRKGLIVLREGETPAAVAASFARIWALPPATESRLTRAIEIQLHRLHG